MDLGVACAEELSLLRVQSLVQQQWLPTVAVYKLLQTVAFGEFLVGCLESFKMGLIAKTLDDVMVAYHSVDL